MKTSNIQIINYWKKLALCFTLLASATFNSCKKFIEVPAPVTQLVTSSVFENDPTATAAQLSLYLQMSNYQWTVHRITGISSDEFINYATVQTSKDLYSNSLTAITDGGIGVWTNSYNYIYQENAILAALQNSTGVSAPVKKQLTGEALFLRSFLYFDLINLYGDVPLITTTDYKVNSNLPRTSSKLVYQQLVSDLKSAQTMLSVNFVDATSINPTSPTDRVRPTSWAATALLAKVYLYTGDFPDAETQATIVINNTAQFSLLNDLTKVFLMNSQEAIWQIPPPNTSTYYTTEGTYFSLINPPATTANNSTSISNQLFNTFEPGDQRKVNWINSYSNGGNTWYYPYKYHANQLATKLTEYTMMLRIAEQYLIRAEARIQQGNQSGGLSDLNTIRNRAGLSNYAGAMDKASLLTAVLHERQVELFTEGHRWYDLKRTGTIDAVMAIVTPQKGGIWVSYQQLYPIPVTDVQTSGNLTQTPGY